MFTGRAVEIEGHNLGVLVNEIREGQLNSIRELASAQAELMRVNADSEPVIISVKTYPDFEELMKELKGDDGHDAGFAGKVRGR